MITTLTQVGNLVLIASSILFAFFAVAGYYTWRSYAHYTGLADGVKVSAIYRPYETDFRKLRSVEKIDGVNKNICFAEWVERRDKAHAEGWLKRIMRQGVFLPLFFIALVLLAIVAFNKYGQYVLPTISLAAVTLLAGGKILGAIEKITQIFKIFDIFSCVWSLWCGHYNLIFRQYFSSFLICFCCV